MKPYLVDVPVRLNVFVRPDTLKKVFSVVKEARPSILFLFSDGPRKNVPTDKEKIAASRKVVENIDWDCKVYRIYFEENQITDGKGFDLGKYIFDKVDRCIFLEDDVVVSVSFFKYCAELLEKYKDDLRIHMINGMNHMGYYDEPNSDYFFSRVGSIWGYATWRRTYEMFHDFSYGDDPYVMKRIKENAKEATNFLEKLEKYYRNDKNFRPPTSKSEFFYSFLVHAQNQLNIVPTKNMVCNIGCTKGAWHAADDLKKMPKGSQQLFYMETYEYDFPLKHPKYVIPDSNYEKNMKRIIGWKNPLVKNYRRCEGILRHIYYGDSKLLFNKAYGKLCDYFK